MIVDGGSTDETLEVIERYADRIDWWVSEPDEGQTHAIGKGLERATGDVFAYINSDDYYLPGAFDTALGALESNDASWVAGAAINVDEHDRPGPGREEPVWPPWPPERFEKRPRGRQWWLTAPWLVPQPSSFWRRELFERYGGFRRDMHFGFDAEFMIRLALAGEMPLLLPEEKLSARVFHPEAKSADLSRTDPDLRRIVEIHRQSLNRRERVLLSLMPLIARLQWLSPAGLRRGVVDPLARLGGNLLEHVPERIRPKIRTRDRRVP
jgi:glycosyltransferase involved in cell wall biosynthesis